MCWNVTGGSHRRLPHAQSPLNAWYHTGNLGNDSNDLRSENLLLSATVIAIDGAAKWETCYRSFQAIFDDCSRDGKAPFGARRYGDEMYIISNGIPDLPQLTGYGAA
jgi:hypothetical protein